MTRLAAVALAAIILAGACGDSTGPGRHPGDWPDRLSQVNGVPADLSTQWTPADAEGRTQFFFAPFWQLWTNGSEKSRTLVLPPGAMVNTSNPSAWSFPEGTMFFKTFSYRNPAGQLRHAETRILRRGATGWETVAYRWDDDQRDARRLAGQERTPVTVQRQDGVTFDHLIPSAADCQDCHGNNPEFILGFNSRQLVEPHSGTTSYLGLAHTAGILSQALTDAPRVPDSTETTRNMLGYFMGNCLHCHNGTRTFSMDPATFMATVVGGPAVSSGIEIVPGDPDASVLYRRVRDRTMPPLGVQVVDQEFLGRLRDWIEQMN